MESNQCVIALDADELDAVAGGAKITLPVVEFIRGIKYENGQCVVGVVGVHDGNSLTSHA